MGYYTDFALTEVDQRPGGFSSEVQEYAEGVVYLDYIIENRGYINSKWYSWREDMSALSAEFPKKRFTLTGDGEESDDHWVAYFHGGEMVAMHSPTITWPEAPEGFKKVTP